jgi:hypothetical protein
MSATATTTQFEIIAARGVDLRAIIAEERKAAVKPERILTDVSRTVTHIGPQRIELRRPCRTAIRMTVAERNYMRWNYRVARWEGMDRANARNAIPALHAELTKQGWATRYV